MRAALALNGLTTFSCFILGEADPNWPVLKNYNFMDTTDWSYQTYYDIRGFPY